MYLLKKTGFHQHTGVETADPYIDDRIFELTGVRGHLERQKFQNLYRLVTWFRRKRGAERRRDIGGRLCLEPKFPIDFFQGKRCLDMGCGAGRWTRVLLTLGAEVKSVDVSPHALDSTRRFNHDVEFLDLFDILPRRSDLHEAFDFTICWGVMMCTHDPRLAFENVAKTVKPNGHLYSMVYAPTYHSSEWVCETRKYFHKHLRTMERN